LRLFAAMFPSESRAPVSNNVRQVQSENVIFPVDLGFGRSSEIDVTSQASLAGARQQVQQMPALGLACSRRISLVEMRGLPGYQRVNLGLVVLVVSEALIDLGAGQSRETGHHLIDGGSGPSHRHHVMDANPRAFDDGVARTHPGPLDDVTVARCNHARTVSALNIGFKHVPVSISTIPGIATAARAP